MPSLPSETLDSGPDVEAVMPHIRIYCILQRLMGTYLEQGKKTELVISNFERRKSTGSTQPRFRYLPDHERCSGTGGDNQHAAVRINLVRYISGEQRRAVSFMIRNILHIYR